MTFLQQDDDDDVEVHGDEDFEETLELLDEDSHKSKRVSSIVNVVTKLKG